MYAVTVENHTRVTEFILLGFSNHPPLQVFLFVLILVVYTITVVGNVGLIIVISIDPQLYTTPMYFLLRNLSFIDLCYSSSVAPKALVNFFSKSKTISYNGCATQFFFGGLFVSTEGFLLVAMSYDRFTAICNPLLYQVNMPRRMCYLLALGSYLCGGFNTAVHTTLMFQLDFCGPNEIDHFFCDLPPLLKLSCSETYINEIVLFSFSTVFIVTASGAILVSYTYIASAILGICSHSGRLKAFSTCASHVMAVALFFGATFYMYAVPSETSSPNHLKVVSMFYCLLIPMLNPIIYSLRNKDVKDALKKTMETKLLLTMNHLI
ncbi:olfactory receptor 1020-like [Alligator sinensis]|uniref:Olfactory receptor n=1 Tax=Alligator sinensis TaxID=38654 RepID=A0A1U7S3Q3_ALLSI|nr:olfactory receptor 1020-like [Alligator sinensis]